MFYVKFVTIMNRAPFNVRPLIFLIASKKYTLGLTVPSKSSKCMSIKKYIDLK